MGSVIEVQDSFIFLSLSHALELIIRNHGPRICLEHLPFEGPSYWPCFLLLCPALLLCLLGLHVVILHIVDFLKHLSCFLQLLIESCLFVDLNAPVVPVLILCFAFLSGWSCPVSKNQGAHLLSLRVPHINIAVE